MVKGGGVVGPDADIADNKLDGLQTLYRDTFTRVYSFLFHAVGGNTAAAEDLTQETFMAAAGQLRKGVVAQSSLSWMLGIARHQLIDHYRSEARIARRRAAAHEVERQRTEAQASSEGARERVYAALVSVPVPQRTVLVLKYLDGLPVLEIAHAIGRSVHATESLLVRGRATFRAAYLGVDDDA
jgi:RNA polymerase sigma-70 factor (ECF subfamily)